MTHRRAYIKACETFGWNGGPTFSTRLVQLANGRERRNADWSQPRFMFLLPFQAITEEAYRSILTMFLNVRGRNEGFLYWNRLDRQAADEIFAVAEPGQAEFQLTKLALVDGIPVLRDIKALYRPANNGTDAVEADPAITIDGVPTSAFTTDHARGIVTFDAPMTGGESLRWSGSFSYWVRFNSDGLPMTIDNRFSGGGFAIGGDIELAEIDPPAEATS